MNGLHPPVSTFPRRSRRWLGAARVFAGIGVALAIIPVWIYGSDSGWYSCGALVNKTGPGLGGGGIAEGCEEVGAYRGRIVAIGVLLVLAVGTAHLGVRRIHGPQRARAAQLVTAAALIASGLVALAWGTNAERAVPYVYSDIEVEFDPVVVPGQGSHRIGVTGDGWNAPTPVLFTTCESFPANCDLDNAVHVEPNGGSFEADLTVDVPLSGTVVAVFDEAVSFYGFARICPLDGCPGRIIQGRSAEELESHE